MADRQVAIVTAAGRGIGEACARELAGRGYAVALMARSEQIHDLARELGGLGYAGSVTQEADLANLVTQTMERFGRIDAVVNSTGHPPKGPLLEIADDDWHAALDLIILSVVRMARLVTPIMERQGGGSIVNISAFTAVQPDEHYPMSSALRPALSSLTKMYSDKYGPANIRMNSVLVGFAENFPQSDETLATIPLRRALTMAEVARTVAFLASEDGSGVTGQQVRVDGGMTRAL